MTDAKALAAEAQAALYSDPTTPIDADDFHSEMHPLENLAARLAAALEALAGERDAAVANAKAMDEDTIGFLIVDTIGSYLSAPGFDDVAWHDGFREFYSDPSKWFGSHRAAALAYYALPKTPIPTAKIVGSKLTYAHAYAAAIALDMHASDCAVHSAPALPAGDCDCFRRALSAALSEVKP